MQAWKAPNIIEWCFLITVGLFGAIGQFLILGAYAKAKAITLQGNFLLAIIAVIALVIVLVLALIVALAIG